MKNLIKIIIAVLMLTTSCSSVWHLKKALKKNPDIIEQRDTVVEVITKMPVKTSSGFIWRDTTLFVTVEAPKLNIEEIPDGTLVQLAKLRNENRESRRKFKLLSEELKQSERTNRKLIRKQRATERVKIKQVEKSNRQAKRQEQKTERVKSRKFVWWIVFFIGGVITGYFLTKRFF